MAYEASGREDLIETIKLTDFVELRITAIYDEEDNFSSLDFRQWYCTRKNPEMNPTQKGFRIGVDKLKVLYDVIGKFI